MLTLSADAACDVCAEEYGPFNLPRSIPCGHILCATCAEMIIDKTLPKHSPACPYCRESFSREGVRVIRIDFSGTSGGGSSSGINGIGGAGDGCGYAETCIGGAGVSMHVSQVMNVMDDETVLYDVRKTRSPTHSTHPSRDPSRATSPERPHQHSSHPNGIFVAVSEDSHRERARELEKKVAKVATKRCSVEEVQALQRELADWLSTDKSLGSNGLSAIDKQQHTAIQLSHLLLRAILMNHVAFSEASKVAKGTEASLRARLADGDLIREKLDDDLRKAKKELAARMQDIMALRTELARLRGGNEEQQLQHTDYGLTSTGAVTPTRRQSLSAPTSPDGTSSGYFPPFPLFSSTSSASTAVPPPRSNPSSGTNSPSSSGRTTPTAGLALGLGLGLGGGLTGSMMPMGSNFPPNANTMNTIGMTLSSAGLGPGPGPGGGNNTNNSNGDRFMTTSGGMSSASSAAAHAQKTFTISAPRPTRSQSTAPGAVRPGTSSASASASANTTPLKRPQSTVPARSGTPANASPSRYGTHGGHVRSASMIHRSATVVPGLSSSSSASASASASNSTPSRDRDRRSTTPAPPPIHQRSASVAPGAMSSASSAATRNLGMGRSMTPNPSSRSSAAKEHAREQSQGNSTTPNGSSAGGANLYGNGTASGIPPVPSLPSHSSYSSSTTGLSRPPVPPKPRTLSQSPSSQRGVVDDRDGYATERETTASTKEKDRKEKKERRGMMMHERWLPSALVDRMTRPATSQG